MLHIQTPIQVLDLMAEAPRGEPLSLGLKPAAEAVLGPDLHPFGPGDHAPLARNTETALGASLLALLGDDLRVDELHHPVVVVGHDHRPAQDSHLGGRQPCALGLLQGLPHIVQQYMEPLVELRHLTALLGQQGIPLHHNLSDGHGYCILLRA